MASAAKFEGNMTDHPTPMRFPMTALSTQGEKEMAEDLKELHKTTLSVILRAALHQFSGTPEEQAVWVEFAKQESKRNE